MIYPNINHRSPIWTKFNDDEFANIVANAFTYKEVMLKCGLKSKGYNNKTLKNRIISLGLDISHFIPHHRNMVISNKATAFTLDSILVENSAYNRTRLKSRLLSAGIFSYKCSMCDNDGIWNGSPLTLQLDHINGIYDDNRLENLRLLCPNCHSQTNTFAGKSPKKMYLCECGKSINRQSHKCVECYAQSRRNPLIPEANVLINSIKSIGYVKTSMLYGVSDNAIRKRLKSNGVDPKSIQKINH